MPSWPGGPCPECGDTMPPNLITCRTCRALLNSDLQQNYVDIPTFIPLEEIGSEEQSSSSSIIMQSELDLRPRILLTPAKGVYIVCPKCQQELKVPRQYLGANVQCNHCDNLFQATVNEDLEGIRGTYIDCPHCNRRVRASRELTNQNVQCNHCGGGIHIELKA